MINASSIYREKLQEVSDLYQQKLSVLGKNTRFSGILADKINASGTGMAQLEAPSSIAADASLYSASELLSGLAGTAGTSYSVSELLSRLTGTATDTVAPKADPSAYDDIIAEAAAQYDLPESLIKGVIRTESSFRANAVSSAGAMGLMQLMPKTAEVYGVTDAFDPRQNILAGSRYIRFQLDRFGDIRLALAAYNTGPSRIKGLNIDDPDDPEQYERISQGVRGYVDKVLKYADYYS